MECSRCGEKQSQETSDEALVSGVAADVWVCLACQEKLCEECEKPGTARNPLQHTCDWNPYSRPCKAPDCTSFMCDECASNAGEAAEQASLSDYYGGSGPMTLDEQHQAAWDQKRALKAGR